MIMVDFKEACDHSRFISTQECLWVAISSPGIAAPPTPARLRQLPLPPLLLSAHCDLSGIKKWDPPDGHIRFKYICNCIQSPVQNTS